MYTISIHIINLYDILKNGFFNFYIVLITAYQGAGTIQEQTMRSIECSLPSLALID